ncbi:GIY-YIG nuclease family protein [Pseudomonas ficuserectae]|uniref:Excinuclease ABC C subunit domain protein n=2 Tax=Pseudomonas amygdali pv. lachrymans TaxID=53707 RepID=A0AB37R044_PSEAV|nr:MULTISPECIES: GIY-YIG nuclease family protein [Pseudomonas syringae group]ARA79932.1 excinuclease ABC subunit C [Pseudomonas amygdali pv. lachrymans]AXH57067.1 GIY-YIG nuclease family protein [Pseudomonas amygdali pv. lachrymans str. M301315]KKY58738.1 excinuclease ABC subunit C [Pseudomonas amygdali pv. lachrymans]MDU8543018.1 GIY-YIG nuclease family protein [Pseudomonas syringae group sp. J248-6]PWD03166.1 excinuclease ABC subunit C [Pseudomonas amygdali pv. lachrymans]
MTDFAFRKLAVKQLPTAIGVYVLCDLDNIPIYVGQSKDGIRSRVARHLTSARSDIIANRQIDVWEIAYVWAYPVAYAEDINTLEAQLFHIFNIQFPLMNGTVPPSINYGSAPNPALVVQVMPPDEINKRRDPNQRLPRQANHYAQLVDHFLTVKNSAQIARAMDAHFGRLQKYHRTLLGYAENLPEDGNDRD